MDAELRIDRFDIPLRRPHRFVRASNLPLFRCMTLQVRPTCPYLSAIDAEPGEPQ